MLNSLAPWEMTECLNERPYWDLMTFKEHEKLFQHRSMIHYIHSNIANFGNQLLCFLFLSSLKLNSFLVQAAEITTDWVA